MRSFAYLFAVLLLFSLLFLKDPKNAGEIAGTNAGFNQFFIIEMFSEAETKKERKADECPSVRAGLCSSQFIIITTMFTLSLCKNRF